MPSFNAVASEKLARLVGTPGCPVVIDLRRTPDQLLPACIPRVPDEVEVWARQFSGQPVVVACDNGRDVSTGIAARLRCEGVQAEVLEGGFRGWVGADLPVIDASALPRRDADGRTWWVTRARPKVDRIACPWLVRRFIDPAARFLFVPPADVLAVAESFHAVPFDVEGAAWSDADDRCTFDAIVDGLRLSRFSGLARLAEIVRGADTARPDLAPQASGLLAISLGLSRSHSDDLAQLEDGMVIYDALYRWCRDAVEETHEPVAHVARRPPRQGVASPRAL